MVDEDRFRRDVPCQRGVGDEMQRKGERHSVTSVTTIAFGFSGCCCFLVKYGTVYRVHLLFHIICFPLRLAMMTFILIAIGMVKKVVLVEETELFIDLIDGPLSYVFTWFQRSLFRRSSSGGETF